VTLDYPILHEDGRLLTRTVICITMKNEIFVIQTIYFNSDSTITLETECTQNHFGEVVDKVTLGVKDVQQTDMQKMWKKLTGKHN
jgi:hypothetical protein